MIDFKRYRKSYFNCCLITKTGCPHRCLFCDAGASFGSSWAPRPPEAILEDLNRDAKEYKFNRLDYFFIDALFNEPLDWAKNLLPQLAGKPRIARADIADGLSLFVVGLFKKVALADYLALYVDRVYAAPDLFGGSSLAMATFAFSWQIYFDFSGYTDMARGIARMMGFNLMLNFRNPYLATGLGDFWNRWHISLSSWFKDYVYIPLGGNRGGKLRTYSNMFLTMVISGFWHGAAWTFVIWGCVHAAGRFVTRELECGQFYRERVPKVLKQLSVFVFVTFAWIFFRAESLSDAVLIIERILSAGFEDSGFPLVALLMCLWVWAYQYLFESKASKLLQWSPVRIGIVILLFFFIAFSTPSHEPFIYFQF